MVAAVGIVLVLLSWWCCWSDALLKQFVVAAIQAKIVRIETKYARIMRINLMRRNWIARGNALRFSFRMKHRTTKNVQFFFLFRTNLRTITRILCVSGDFFYLYRVSAFILIAYFFCVSSVVEKRENIHRFNGCGWQ